MEKLIIADVTSLTYGEVIYGHFLKFAQQYNNI